MTADADTIPDHLQSDPKARIRAACTVWRRTNGLCCRCGGVIVEGEQDGRATMRVCEHGCPTPGFVRFTYEIDGRPF